MVQWGVKDDEKVQFGGVFLLVERGMRERLEIWQQFYFFFFFFAALFKLCTTFTSTVLFFSVTAILGRVLLVPQPPELTIWEFSGLLTHTLMEYFISFNSSTMIWDIIRILYIQPKHKIPKFSLKWRGGSVEKTWGERKLTRGERERKVEVKLMDN